MIIFAPGVDLLAQARHDMVRGTKDQEHGSVVVVLAVNVFGRHVIAREVIDVVAQGCSAAFVRLTIVLP